MTATETKSAVKTVLAVSEAIRELGRVPAGTLYANVMTAGMSLANLEAVLGVLERAKMIQRTGHELVWIGPQPCLAVEGDGSKPS